MRKCHFLTVVGGLLLTACAPGTEFQTVGGSKAYLSDPVAVDVVEANFNIPFFLPQIDSVQRSLRYNGSVVHEAYFAGESRVAMVEHLFDSWFNHISIDSARDEVAFRLFLSQTPMQAHDPVILEAGGERTFGFLATDGGCVAFRFVKRIKGSTGYDSDNQDTDTFVAGYACDADGDKFVRVFGFMSASDRARVDRRNSI